MIGTHLALALKCHKSDAAAEGHGLTYCCRALLRSTHADSSETIRKLPPLTRKELLPSLRDLCLSPSPQQSLHLQRPGPVRYQIAHVASTSLAAHRPSILALADCYADRSGDRRDEGADGRAHIVIKCINPVAEVWGSDGNSLPRFARIRIHGLQYDSASGAVIYDDGTKRTVCAAGRERKVLLWTSASLEPTGA
jgi:hypothetical protein